MTFPRSLCWSVTEIISYPLGRWTVLLVQSFLSLLYTLVNATDVSRLEKGFVDCGRQERYRWSYSKRLSLMVASVLMTPVLLSFNLTL